MISPYFVLLGVAFNFFGGLTYLSDTLKGKVKPNRVSWGIWAVAPLIAFSAQLSQGVGIQSLMTFMVGFMPLTIFIASFFNKKSYWRLGRLDMACGALSIIGLVGWYLTKVGNVAIAFSIVADFLAGVPTLIKAYRYPETENYLVFACSCLSALIAILTINDWRFQYYGFPIYIFLFDLTAVLLIGFKHGRENQPRELIRLLLLKCRQF